LVYLTQLYVVITLQKIRGYLWGSGYFVATSGNITDEVILEYIFDKIAVIPNWNSGSIDDMQSNKAFFREGKI
jgi:hypothetical protein